MSHSLCTISDDSAYASAPLTATTISSSSSAVAATDDEASVLSGPITPLKRKRPSPSTSDVARTKRTSASPAIVVVPPPIVHPKSLYDGYVPPLPRHREVEVLKRFAEARVGDGYVYYRFEDFRAYNTNAHSRFPLEMLPLNAFNVARGSAEKVLMDGILVDDVSEERYYVEGILIDRASIDHDEAVGQPRVWVQSLLNSAQKPPGSRGYVKGADKIWYTLGRPAEEYERYHRPFLWLAAFGRYFVSYAEARLEEMEAGWKSLTLECFRSDFAAWCERQYAADPYFQRWKQEYRGRKDFRMAVSAHKEWLWNQAFGVSDADTMKLRLWDEVLHLNAIPAVQEQCIDETIVTPYVYNCFYELFTSKLRVVYPPGTEPEERPSRGGLKVEVVIDLPSAKAKTGLEYSHPKVGDVVAIEMDENSQWKAETRGGDQRSLWFAYVTRVAGARLSVVWLYKPADTILHSPCGAYPHPNELFFSDHCNCDCDAPLLAKDVVRVVSVDFFGSPLSKTDYFVRQKYQTEDPGFVTLQESDLEVCPCQHEPPHPYVDARTRYDVGDTVLVASPDDTLEPVAIQQFHDDSMAISVRRLERRQIDEPATPPNELVYTHTFATVFPEHIVRPCHVRVFLPGEPIQAPYDRNGCGDCFYITQESVNGIVVPMSAYPPDTKLRQGFNLEGEELPRPKLRGMDLFCGGGNFGRGMEEGGAVQMKWAVDIEGAPLHSYRANLKDVNDTALYLGSINNYLNSAILGKYSSVIAAPGEVEFISAGSPCQGFSLANGLRNSERSIQNCSLVSSLATAIDLYRPKYALLENVHQIAQARQLGERGECNVFSSMLNCIVGMGYQCQQFILDSWSYGNCQSRTRLFLAVSAPTEKLLKRPPRSHAHPPGQRILGLYRAPNGEKFGHREMAGACPFPHRSPAQDFAPLPNIHDNHVGVCIPFPDHRISRTEAAGTRMMLSSIPRFPAGEGWRSAVLRGRMHPDIQRYDASSGEKGRKLSKAWRRVSEHALVRTITTTLTPQCSRTGTWVHYKEPRLLSVQEARIAQGFPDGEVLVGETSRQFKVVGNSVARGVSVAMGLALRRAYFGMQEY